LIEDVFDEGVVFWNGDLFILWLDG
jgi:hypothetical protein